MYARVLSLCAAGRPRRAVRRHGIAPAGQQIASLSQGPTIAAPATGARRLLQEGMPQHCPRAHRRSLEWTHVKESGLSTPTLQGVE